MGEVSRNYPRVCVVGAGPQGLIAARALRSCGVNVQGIERFTDVGGIWDMNNLGTPMYESCHFISSSKGTHYPDFRMPESYPDYPSNRQILDYIRSFARAFDLYSLYEFGVAVEKAEPGQNGEWNVHLSNGETRTYDGLVCCPGATWAPRMPELEGAFSGRIIHSSEYKSAAEFAGKRVLVIGLGNSGADIACDAAQVAEDAIVSTRRGYHVVPKHVFGVATLDFLSDPSLMPESMSQIDFADILKVVTGDFTRFGMPAPDHAFGESHALVNTEILHHLGHGRLRIKGGIERLEGDSVRFADGSVERVDVIVCATGYDHALPFLDKSLFQWTGDRLDLYLTAFNRAHPTLFVVGLVDVAGVPYAAQDQLSLMIGEYMCDRRSNPERAARFENLLKTDFPDLRDGVNYVQSARMANYVNLEPYLHHIERVRQLMGYTQTLPGRYVPVVVNETVAS